MLDSGHQVAMSHSVEFLVVVDVVGQSRTLGKSIHCVDCHTEVADRILGGIKPPSK